MIFLSVISNRTRIEIPPNHAKFYIYAPLEVQAAFLKVPHCTVVPIPTEFVKSGPLNVQEKLQLLQHHIRETQENTQWYFCIDPDELPSVVELDSQKLHLFDNRILVHPQIVGGSKQNLSMARPESLYDETKNVKWPYTCRAKDILHHLGIGGKIPFPFPVEEQLSVKLNYRSYGSELLTRSMCDHGFHATKNRDAPYTLVLSHGNAFFTTNARALLHQFEREEIDVMVGGTRSNEERTYLRSIAKGPFWYPDGRFILGKTSTVNRVLRLLKRESLASIIERKTFPIHIDCNQEFFREIDTRKSISSLAPIMYHSSITKNKDLHDLYINLNDDYYIPASSTVIWTIVIVCIFLIVYMMFILVMVEKNPLDEF